MVNKIAGAILYNAASPLDKRSKRKENRSKLKGQSKKARKLGSEEARKQRAPEPRRGVL
jgi:hypothetical protein